MREDIFFEVRLHFLTKSWNCWGDDPRSSTAHRRVRSDRGFWFWQSVLREFTAKKYFRNNIRISSFPLAMQVHGETSSTVTPCTGDGRWFDVENMICRKAYDLRLSNSLHRLFDCNFAHLTGDLSALMTPPRRIEGTEKTSRCRWLSRFCWNWFAIHICGNLKTLNEENHSCSRCFALPFLALSDLMTPPEGSEFGNLSKWIIVKSKTRNMNSEPLDFRPVNRFFRITRIKHSTIPLTRPSQAQFRHTLEEALGVSRKSWFNRSIDRFSKAVFWSQCTQSTPRRRSNWRWVFSCRSIRRTFCFSLGAWPNNRPFTRILLLAYVNSHQLQ